MNTHSNNQPAKYEKAKPGASVVKLSTKKKKNSLKTVFLVFALLLFVVGSVSVLLISRKQELETTPVTPNVPQSKPSAFIPEEESCGTSFTVTTTTELIVCGDIDCEEDSDCASGLVCLTTEELNYSGDPIKYCALPAYEIACIADPSVETCCTEPTITDTPELIVCGDIDCEEDNDCASGLVCLTTEKLDTSNDPIKYCALPAYEATCIADPSVETCCTEPTETETPTETPTDTPTETPTDTPTPVITEVITTINCNDSCNENADCSNISHICYNGRCRLDVNPTDVNCRLPNGDNTIERPIDVPTESGFADWFNFLKAGLGILGVGSLLLLLL